MGHTSSLLSLAYRHSVVHALEWVSALSRITQIKILIPTPGLFCLPLAFLKQLLRRRIYRVL